MLERPSLIQTDCNVTQEKEGGGLIQSADRKQLTVIRKFTASTCCFINGTYHWFFLIVWDWITEKLATLLRFIPCYAAIMTVAAKECVELKGGKWKWPWKGPLPRPLVGFQSALIISWRGRWLQSGHIFNTEQTPESVFADKCAGVFWQPVCANYVAQLCRMYDP